MLTHDKRTRSVLRALILPILVAALTAGLSASPAPGCDARTVKVMTYNMDAGTDFLYLLDPSTPLPQAVQLTVEEVMATDFAGRAASMADQIGAAAPDLVALQEVTLWEMMSGHRRVQVVADQLALLTAALEAKGLHYTVVTVERLTDLSVPLSDTLTIRYVDRDAVLVRSDAGRDALKISNIQAAKYAATIDVLGMFEQVNGWISMDVTAGPRRFRFFATHLESPLAPDDSTQLAQANELIALMNDSPLPVILAGDFNSDAAGGIGGGPDRTASAGLLRDNGYADAWKTLGMNESDGFTWPLFFEDGWEDRGYSLPSERIDLIFLKGVEPVTIERVGVTQPFPSDHAGVVATLLLEK